jgi:hypothetical protein
MRIKRDHIKNDRIKGNPITTDRIKRITDPIMLSFQMEGNCSPTILFK